MSAFHSLRARLYAVLASRAEDLQHAEDWDALIARAQGSRGVFISCENLDSQLARQLVHLASEAPHVPIVVVANATTSMTSALRERLVESVIAEESGAESGSPASSGIDAFMLACARKAEQSEHLPDRLRRAIAFAFEANPPVRSVATLMRRVRAKPTSTRRDWTRHFGTGQTDSEAGPSQPFNSGTRAKSFVQTVLLGRAIGYRRAGASWKQVETALRVTSKSLRTYARAVPGLSSGLNQPSDEATYRAHVIKNWLPWITGSPQSGDARDWNEAWETLELEPEVEPAPKAEKPPAPATHATSHAQPSPQRPRRAARVHANFGSLSAFSLPIVHVPAAGDDGVMLPDPVIHPNAADNPPATGTEDETPVADRESEPKPKDEPPSPSYN